MGNFRADKATFTPNILSSFFYCRLPSYIYNILYNDRDPIDAVAFTKYIHNRKEKMKAVCNKKEKDTSRHLFQFLYKSDDNQAELFMTQLTREFPEHINLW